jgi:hypothetical protein
MSALPYSLPLSLVVLRAFIANRDERGFAKYPDATYEIVVAPADSPDHTTPLPFVRNPKSGAMIAGVAADGTALKPLIIVPRNTLEAELIS